MSAAPQTPDDLNRALEATRRLKAAWGATRFVTWDKFIKYFNPGARHYSPDTVSRADRIWEKLDVNAMIEARLKAIRNGDAIEASRIRGELLAAGVELIDEVAPISRTVSTKWELAS